MPIIVVITTLYTAQVAMYILVYHSFEVHHGLAMIDASTFALGNHFLAPQVL